MKKGKILLFVSILMLITLCVGCGQEKENQDEKEIEKITIEAKDKQVANMYYSNVSSEDVIIEYTIVIYENEGKFKYQVMESKLDHGSIGDKKEIKVNLLNTKDDLIKLNKEYQKGNTSKPLYHSLKEGFAELDTIEDLAKLLFEN